MIAVPGGGTVMQEMGVSAGCIAAVDYEGEHSGAGVRRTIRGAKTGRVAVCLGKIAPARHAVVEEHRA